MLPRDSYLQRFAAFNPIRVFSLRMIEAESATSVNVARAAR